MIKKYKIKIEKNLYNFINLEVLPGTLLNEDMFWKNFSELINELGPINKELLVKRKYMQSQIDSWHKKNLGKEIDINDYKNFLMDIGYLVQEDKDFFIDTEKVDQEISKISGPQLVVPITNSRYALNAVNARWGSLYDAIYGTDILGDLPNSEK